MPPKTLEWNFLFCGFLQRDGDVNGMVALWDELRRTRSSPEFVVERHAWYSRAGDLAEMVSAFRDRQNTTPRINVVGYSWGGTTALNFARCLKRRGLNVARMVLCDAVYRPPVPLGYSLAFCPWMRLLVPNNVGHVIQFRQRTSWPRGHRIVAEDPHATWVEKPIFLPHDHIHMDDAVQFHQAVRMAVFGGWQGSAHKDIT